MQRDGKDTDQDQGQAVVRDTDAADAKDGPDPGKDRIRAVSAVNADQNTEQEGKNTGAQSQDQGIIQRVADNGQHQAVIADRVAEIALDRIPQPHEVLNIQRLVKSVSFNDDLAQLIGSVQWHDAVHRLARHELQQSEHDDRYAQQGQKRQTYSF